MNAITGFGAEFCHENVEFIQFGVSILLGFACASDGHGDPANQGSEVFISAIITTRCIYIENNMVLGCARTDGMIRLTAPMRALACETPKRVRKKGFDHTIRMRVR